MDSGLSEKENNALRASSLLVVPPAPAEVQPLEGLQGTNLPEANLTQWASCVQDVASGMQRPPHAALECPNQDIAGFSIDWRTSPELAFAISAMPWAALVDVRGQRIRPSTVMGVWLYGPRPSPVMPQWHLQQ